MKSFNIWKKIAAGILFLNIALTSFIGQPVAAEGTEGQPAIQRMGFSSKLSIGPGSQLFDRPCPDLASGKHKAAQTKQYQNSPSAAFFHSLFPSSFHISFMHRLNFHNSNITILS